MGQVLVYLDFLRLENFVKLEKFEVEWFFEKSVKIPIWTPKSSIFIDFQWFQEIEAAKPENFYFQGYVCSGLKGSEWKKKETNTRNEELSMSRCTQHILKFFNSKNSQIYSLLKSAVFLENHRISWFSRSDVKKDLLFTQLLSNIVSSLRISLTTAPLGSDIEVRLLDWTRGAACPRRGLPSRVP